MVTRALPPKEFEAQNVRQGRQGTQVLTVLIASLMASIVVWMFVGLFGWNRVDRAHIYFAAGHRCSGVMGFFADANGARSFGLIDTEAFARKDIVQISKKHLLIGRGKALRVVNLH